MDKSTVLNALYKTMEKYCPISSKTRLDLARISLVTTIYKNEYFCKYLDHPQSMAFVHSGLLRAYISDGKGNEYNKIFFPENSLAASVVSLLTNSPSLFTIQALETSYLLKIDYRKYRELLESNHDLKWFQIYYLEQNWVIAKEKREVSLVQATAKQRYHDFLREYPNLEKRIPQFHIASHIGVTPTQLSRIRKELKNQHM